MVPTRDEAWALLNEFNKSEALIKHALAVEGVMRHCAGVYGEDAAAWGIIGLLHDLDYERHPDQHCVKTMEIMRERGIDEEFIRACVSHGYGLCVDIEPISLAERVLYAIDELTGLVAAAALMRPSRSVMDLEVKSVMKKYKTRSFAAGCDRDLIDRGCRMLDSTVDDIVAHVIAGMRAVHAEIGL
jgi:putative nucleotidyltransferase with HDIG domain